jgi:hypothetical protein
MFSLCRYKYALGVPKKGIHSRRFLNMALADILMTFAGALLLKYLFFPRQKYLWVLFWLFISGILLHRLFCVRTTIDRVLFP